MLVGVYLFFHIFSLKALRRLYEQVHGAFGLCCERASSGAMGASASLALVQEDGEVSAAPSRAQRVFKMRSNRASGVNHAIRGHVRSD